MIDEVLFFIIVAVSVLIILLVLVIVFIACSAFNSDSEKKKVKLNNISNFSLQIENYLRKNQINLENVIVWRKGRVYIDDKKRKIYYFYITDRESDKVKLETINFDDIISCELVEDTITNADDTANRLISGAVMGGWMGAMLMSESGKKPRIAAYNLSVKVTSRNIKKPMYMITIFREEYDGKFLDRQSGMYGELYNIASTIHSAINSLIENNKEEIFKNKTNNIETKTDNVKIKLKELKEMLDDGLITKEEFEGKKKDILSKM